MTVILSATDFRAKAKADLREFSGRFIRIYGPGRELVASGKFRGIALATPLTNPLYPTTPAHVPFYAFTDHDDGPEWKPTHTVEID